MEYVFKNQDTSKNFPYTPFFLNEHKYPHTCCSRQKEYVFKLHKTYISSNSVVLEGQGDVACIMLEASETYLRSLERVAQ